MKNRKNYTFVTGLKRLVIAGVVAAMVTTPMESVWGNGVVTASAATDKVKIDTKAFPDSKFRLYVKYYFDTNSDGYLSKKERNNAELISAKSWKISSLLRELSISLILSILIVDTPNSLNRVKFQKPLTLFHNCILRLRIIQANYLSFYQLLIADVIS